MAQLLLVEDDPLVCDELKVTLENHGHAVVTARNGVVALRHFERTEFDCVISDIIMPDMEGIGMMMEMRRKSPGTKIIMMSGGGLAGKDQFLLAAAKLGAAATMRKPIHPIELLDTLAKCLASGGDVPGRSSAAAHG